MPRLHWSGRGFDVNIVQAERVHIAAWAEMRAALWPWDDADDHAEQIEALFEQGSADLSAFIAFDEDGGAIGFAEGSLRRDYVEGCETSPVAYLEGVYVKPEARKIGVARALADAVGDWGRATGCTEYASDALLDNVDSHRFHAAIGFAETERVVYFRKEL